jgi:predicted membrane-bound spermidine synthase
MKGMSDIFTDKIEYKSVLIVHDGLYVRLHINGTLWMSDTNMEKVTNSEFVRNANGKVLIAGLGIGLIIRNIQDKPEVKEIIVVEQSQDLIDVIQPYFPDVKMICSDIHDYTPEKDEKFDTVYFDIWQSLNTDNIVEMNGLARKFRKYLNKENPECFISSWAIDFLRYERKKELRESY